MVGNENENQDDDDHRKAYNSRSALQQQVKALNESLEQANNSAILKDQKCRHLETRVEEQQAMIRQLAKQLSDVTLHHQNGRSTVSSSSTSIFVGQNQQDGDDDRDEFDDGKEHSSPSKNGLVAGAIGASRKTSSAFKDFVETALFSIESAKNQFQRLFHRYKVLAPLFLGITFLIFFMIWFSKGSGPTVNRVEMFSKRTEQLEQELSAVREAYARLNEKCAKIK